MSQTSPFFLHAKAIALLWRGLSTRSLATLWRLAWIIGPQIYRFSRRERHVTDVNLGEVFPHSTAISGTSTHATV